MNIELSAEEIQMVQAALSNHKDKLWSQIHELQHPFKGYDVRLHEKWRAKADEAIALSKRIGSDFAAPPAQAVSMPDGSRSTATKDVGVGVDVSDMGAHVCMRLGETEFVGAPAPHKGEGPW